MGTDDHPVLKHPDVKRWLEAAVQVTPTGRLQARIPTLVQEAPRLAAAARELWKPTTARPGLQDAGAVLPPDLPEQLESLSRALAEVHQALETEILSDTAERQLWERGRFVVAELRSLLLYVADALELETVPQGLEVEAAHLVDHRDLATVLSSLAKTARSYEDTIQQVSSFDGALVGEAEQLAGQLQALEAGAARDRPEVVQLNDVRARLALLLQARVRLLQSAARFVFRDHPSLLQNLLGDVLHLEPGADFRIQQVLGKRVERHGPTHIPYV
jgi:hypothetical protein